MLVAVGSDTDDASGVDELGKAGLNELLAKVAEGDQTAFAELYDQCASRVFGLVRHLLKDAAQSEEVTQEIFLEVWQNSKRYDPAKGSAITWILTMSHRRAVDRIRSAQSTRNRDTKIGLRDIEVDYDSVTESVEIRMEHERVEQALLRLTELQRQAVTLAYYGGYSHSEVAEMLAVPIGTVKTRLRDGMIRLRDELGVTS
jgi:RNA polymerase sigma-70 factor (ECF subfamily)